MIKKILCKEGQRHDGESHQEKKNQFHLEIEGRHLREGRLLPRNTRTILGV